MMNKSPITMGNTNVKNINTSSLMSNISDVTSTLNGDSNSFSENGGKSSSIPSFTPDYPLEMEFQEYIPELKQQKACAEHKEHEIKEIKAIDYPKINLDYMNFQSLLDKNEQLERKIEEKDNMIESLKLRLNHRDEEIELLKTSIDSLKRMNQEQSKQLDDLKKRSLKTTVTDENPVEELCDVTKPFQCEICRFSFTQKNHLNRHYRIHSGIRPYLCDICGNSFKEKENLKRHYRIHTGERPFQCEHCEYSSVDKENLKRHLRTHTGERPFACQECGRSFALKKDLKRHHLIHTGERPFICELCNCSFNRKDKLNQHLRNHANKSSRVTKMVNKADSNSNNFTFNNTTIGQFSSNQIYSNSLNISNDNESSQQIIKDELEEEIETLTTNVDINICKLLNDQRESEKLLDPIKKKDNGPFACQECDYSCNKKSLLTRHFKIHSGKRRFHCEICGKTFSIKKDLKRHQIIHTGQRPFQCEFCERSFYRKDKLTQHLRVHVK